MKLGSEELSANALKRRVRPLEEPVLLTSASMLESESNPRPMTPLPPFESAGFEASETSRNACDEMEILDLREHGGRRREKWGHTLQILQAQ